MSTNAFNTSRLIQLFDKIGDRLECFIREASSDRPMMPLIRRADTHEAVHYLEGLGLAPSAARLEDCEYRLNNCWLDACLCNYARGKSAEHKEWLTEKLGRYPAPGGSEHEHNELQRDLWVLSVEAANEMTDLVREVRCVLTGDKSQMQEPAEKARVQPKKRQRMRSARKADNEEYKRAREDAIAQAIRKIASEGKVVTSPLVSKKCTGQDDKRIPEGTVRQSEAWKNRERIMQEVGSFQERYERFNYYSPEDHEIVDESAKSVVDDLIDHENADEV